MQQLIGLIASVCLSLGAVAPDESSGSATSDACDTAAQYETTVTYVGLALPGLPVEEHWRVHQTDHFSIAFDRDHQRAALQGALLEATHRRFYDTLGGPTFEVEPVRDRLVCLLFEDKGEYLEYAQQADRVDMSWTVAYYSARTNRTAFYRYGSQRRGGEQRHAEADSEQLYGSAMQADELSHEHRISLASATHEAAHQLAFNSGLQKRGVLYPLWVSEGLATNFELTALDGEFGPDRDNPTRRQRLRRAYDHGDLIPLQGFVAVTRPPTRDAAATDTAYAQSWGLFRYLYLHQPDALAAYLEDLAALPRGSRPRSALRQEFARHFGSIDRVEADWRDWIESLESR